ncbi:putative ankyrin repeat protein RF_0381 [Haliotis cracherodii]|uniref:putative ankyrin repeat protein RF_0381 n=1 Tax=Haliotis cracherodii TaxID=6455 RepID=UPI0039E9242D
MSLQTTKLYKSIINDDLDQIVLQMLNYVRGGGDMNVCDGVTGETFMHHVINHVHKFMDPKTVSLLYLLACKPIDLNAQDSDGNTALHKVVRKKGAYRAMVALIRCGGSMDVKNKKGHTPEDILLKEKPGGWEEMLHWYRKFKPGLWAAVFAPNPDKRVIERLLKSWCRVTVFKNGKVTNMKCLAHAKAGQLDIVYLLEKYENTIEFALGVMAAVQRLCGMWKDLGFDRNTVDVNTKDHSYQFSYPDFPEEPQPLLAAAWEKDVFEVLEFVMTFKPDTNVLYAPISDPQMSPNPLFFHMFSGPGGPKDERIVHCVLKNSDLTARGRQGGTVLLTAITSDQPEHIIRALFDYGVNVASRARCGRTVRDIAQGMGKSNYVQMIDDHVIDIINTCNIERLDTMILQAYDHILDITDEKGRNALQLARKQDSKQLVTILQNIVATQDHAKKVFLAIDRGNKPMVKKLLTKKYANALDRCSRTVLHHALLHRQADIVRTLLEDYPQLINKFDCMGRTPLHYANLFMDQDTIDFLLKKGANENTKDTQGLTPRDYSKIACSPHEFQVRQADVQDFDLEIFLGMTNFFDTFYHACRTGDLATVKNLTLGLNEHGAQHRFSNALFDCLDHRQYKVAEFLVKNGFSTDVWKQYEECDPDDPMCSMMECSHTVVTLRQRAVNVGAKDIVKLIDNVASGKVKTLKPSTVFHCEIVRV